MKYICVNKVHNVANVYGEIKPFSGDGVETECDLERHVAVPKDSRSCGGVGGGGINLSNPTGHVMHQQFNIQQLYALPTLYLCVLYLSENKQRLVPLTA